MAFKRNVEGQKKIITLCLGDKSKICVWERARETQTDGEEEIERRERDRQMERKRLREERETDRWRGRD